MSSSDGGDGKVGAFMLGFLLGVIVCLGAGGAFYMAQARQAAALAEEARAAHEMAVHAERQAMMERDRARHALEAAKKVAGEDEKDKKDN